MKKGKEKNKSRLRFADSEIIEAVNKSDGKNRMVMEFLYQRILPKVQDYVVKNSGNSDDAFDVFQDAMVAFCKYIKQGKFNPAYTVSGFIYTVAKNVWINKAKKNKRIVFATTDEKLESSFNQENALTHIITVEREQEVITLMDKLGEKCRKLLKMAIYEELSGKEICKKMGFASENGVKTQKYKCKQKLLQIIKEQKSTLLDRE